MFQHGTTYLIDSESGIQLNMSDSQFSDGLCSLMMDLRAAVDDPMSYLVKKHYQS
jgi:hypothetical protein